jgi:hypothetical protein
MLLAHLTEKLCEFRPNTWFHLEQFALEKAVFLWVTLIARADEPALGECPARAYIEWPRWPLALLASAARARNLSGPRGPEKSG